MADVNEGLAFVKPLRGGGMLNLCLRFFLLFAFAATAGCAKWNTAYRVSELGTGQNRPVAVTVDAKQRHLLFAPDFNSSGQLVPGKYRMCAEASPDVFSAIAASGSGLINVDAKSQSGGFNLGLSAAETAASIERTQTINLLRESFFRTCERYLSGAIGPKAFVVQAGRDARAMVAVLAIEQFTGTVRRPSVVISGPATAAQAQAAGEIAKLYPAAAKRRNEAEAAYKPLAGKESVDCDKEADDKKAACNLSKDKAIAAKKELDTAQARVDEIMKISGDIGNSASAASASPGTNNASNTDVNADKSDISALSASVFGIVRDIIYQDEILLMCLTEIDQQECRDYLFAKVRAETGMLNREFSDSMSRIRLAQDGLFSTFLSRCCGGTFSSDGVAKSVAEFLGRMGPVSNTLKSRSGALASAQNRQQAAEAFGRLPPDIQQKLGE